MLRKSSHYDPNEQVLEANENDEDEGTNQHQEVSKSGSFNKTDEEDDEIDDFDVMHEESVDDHNNNRMARKVPPNLKNMNQ